MKNAKVVREYKGKSLVDFIDDYVCVDIETNGLVYEKSEIIEIGAIKVVGGKEVERFSSLIKPDYYVTSFVTELTGITNQMLENQDSIDVILPKFIDFLQDNIILGHNVNFDVNFLYDNCMKVFNSPLTNDFIDTLRLARRILPKSKLYNHKLHTLCKYYNITQNNAHRAIGDCESTIELYNNLKKTEFEYV